MLANYNKISKQLLFVFMLPCVEGVFKHLHFQVYNIRLRSQVLHCCK